MILTGAGILTRMARQGETTEQEPSTSARAAQDERAEKRKGKVLEAGATA